MNVPPAFNVPAPVNVILEETPADVILPVTVTEPVEIVISVYCPAPLVARSAMEPAVNEPPPTAIVVLQLAVVERLAVIVPETVREFAPLMVMPLLATVGAVMSIEAQLAGVSTVTVTVALIVTVSPLVGTALPPQVAVSLQLPDTLAVLAAACAAEAQSRTAKKAAKQVEKGRKTRKPPLSFFIGPLLEMPIALMTDYNTCFGEVVQVRIP